MEHRIQNALRLLEHIEGHSKLFHNQHQNPQHCRRERADAKSTGGAVQLSDDDDACDRLVTCAQLTTTSVESASTIRGCTHFYVIRDRIGRNVTPCHHHPCRCRHRSALDLSSRNGSG